jgi:hypothetical protein
VGPTGLKATSQRDRLVSVPPTSGVRALLLRCLATRLRRHRGSQCCRPYCTDRYLTLHEPPFGLLLLVGRRPETADCNKRACGLTRGVQRSRRNKSEDVGLKYASGRASRRTPFTVTERLSTGAPELHLHRLFLTIASRSLKRDHAVKSGPIRNIRTQRSPTVRTLAATNDNPSINVAHHDLVAVALGDVQRSVRSFGVDPVCRFAPHSRGLRPRARLAHMGLLCGELGFVARAVGARLRSL